MQAGMVAVDDGSVPGATPEEKKATLEKWARYNLDRYYELVQDLTFPTIFLPLSRPNASLLIKGQLPDDLTTQLHDAIQRVGGQHGAFVRLSTRSPKDAVDKMPDRLAPFLKELINSSSSSSSSSSSNATLITLRRAFARTLCVHSADEAIHILSLSSRTVSDVVRASSHTADHDHDGDQPSSWDMQLVVRQFCAALQPHGEFRVLVRRGRVRGISQYDTLCYFPHLMQCRSTIRTLIVAFQRKLHARIHQLFEDYVLDVALIDDAEARTEEGDPIPEKVVLVEINPWDEHTGAALFDWHKDAALLQADNNDNTDNDNNDEDDNNNDDNDNDDLVVLRVVEADRKPVLPREWRDFVDTATSTPQPAETTKDKCVCM